MSIFLKDGTIFITICWHLIILSGFSEIEFLNCRAPAKGAGKTKKNETQITSQDNPLTPPAFQSACVAPVYCRCRLINTIGSTWAQCALQTPSELSCQRGFPLQRHFWDFGCILVCCMARDNIAYAVSSLTHSLTLLAILNTHPMASLSSFFGSLV